MSNNNGFVFGKEKGGDGAQNVGFPECLPKVRNPFAPYLSPKEKKEENELPKNPPKIEEEKKEENERPKNPPKIEEEKKDENNKSKKNVENNDRSKSKKRTRDVYCQECNDSFTTEKSHNERMHPEMCPTPKRIDLFKKDRKQLEKTFVHMNKIVNSMPADKIQKICAENQAFKEAYEYYLKKKN